MVAVVGSINRDIIVRVPTLPVAGQTVIGESVAHAHGGKGANQAAASASTEPAEVRTALVGVIGTDPEGNAELDSLEALGIDTRFVARHSKTGTGTAFVTVDHQGSNQIVVIPGANAQLTSNHVTMALEELRPAVVLTSLEIPHDAVAAAIGAGRRAGATVIVNPAPYRSLATELLAMVDIITPNEIEFRQMMHAPANDVLDKDSITRLISLAAGVSNETVYLVTLGADGAVLVNDGVGTHLPAPFVEVVDTTGSGDALNGCLAAGIASGQNLLEAAVAAIDLASSVATWHGARLEIPRRN